MATKGPDKASYDYLLIVIVATLLVIGMLMVYSTTFSIDQENPTFFFGRQAIGGVIGLVALIVFARTPYRRWRRLSIFIMGIALVGLLAVLVLNQWRFGARLSLLEGRFQPGEFAKLAVVLYVADWLSSKGDKIRRVTYGLIPFAVLIGCVAGLIVLQPDYGTAILIVATAMVMFFLAGADLLQLVIGTVFGGATFLVLITRTPYAEKRVTEFLQSLNDPVGAGTHQVRQALIALGFGGVFGRGLGDSQQKFEFLPLSHTDSIFAILGEELGLIGCLVVIGLFAALAYRGFRIALQSPDSFGMILAAGVTCWLIFQALINISSVTATLPPTGIPLPFISYGGSSLVAALAGVGLLLSISRGTRGEDVRVHANFDVRRGNSRPRLASSGSRSGTGRRRKSKNE